MLNIYLEFLETDNIYLDTFDPKFMKTIENWDNIGYYPKQYNTTLYTLMVNNKKAGIIGFVLTSLNTHFLQIAISKKFRGLNLLSKGTELLAKKHNIKRLYSTVFLDNYASYKSHIKSGFKELPKKEVQRLIDIGKIEKGSVRFYKDF
jgi:L-amino acid N-acyltransferase YncA